MNDEPVTLDEFKARADAARLADTRTTAERVADVAEAVRWVFDEARETEDAETVEEIVRTRLSRAMRARLTADQRVRCPSGAMLLWVYVLPDGFPGPVRFHYLAVPARGARFPTTDGGSVPARPYWLSVVGQSLDLECRCCTERTTVDVDAFLTGR